MLGLSSGLIKGTSVLRSIVKKGIQAWYKADNTQAPLGEEEIVNGSFDTGPEIITNGDFSTSGSIDNSSHSLGFQNSGGVTGGGTISNGELILVGDTGDREDYGRVFITNGVDSTSVVTATKTYKLTYTVSSASGTIQFGYHNGGWNEGSLSHAVGTHTYYITQASGTTFIIKNNGDGGTLKLSSISLKQTNPNDSWSEVTATGSTVEFKDGTVDLVTDGANVNIQQTILTVGKKYKAEIDFTKNSGAGLKVQDGGGLVIGNISSSGQHSFDFTATNAIFLIARDGSSAGNYTVNSVSVKEITNSVKDFSSNNNNGVLHSGKALIFDGNGDYVDGGLVSNDTTVFTTAFWAKVNNTSSQRAVLQYGKTLVQFNTSGNLQCWPSTSGSSGGNNSVVFSMSNIDTTAWNRYVLIIDGYDISLYVNNDHINTTQTSGPDLITSGEDNFNIGRYEVSREFDGMIADLQIYDKAWTFSDVAYDYNNPDKDVFDDEGRVATTIGSELHTNANPASVINESSSIETSPYGIPSWTHNFITSDSSVTNNSNFSIKFQATSSGNRSYIDLNQTLTIGKQYKLQVDVRHVGSGDDFILQFNRENTLNTGVNQKVIATITSSDTDFVTYTEIFVHDGSTRFFGVKENGNNYNAGGYIDNLTIKEYQSPCEISPTDCKALYRLNEGAGNRVYNAAPVLGSEMVSNGDFSSIGQELVANGSFATSSGWGNSDGIWSISGGKASVDTTSSTTLTQTVSVVDNKLYNLSFEISDYVKGNFQVEFGGGKPTQSVSANGVYNYTVSSPATNVILYLYALNESKFSIDNISIKEIEGDWRALEGSNQYLGWSQTGWSIANGKASVDHNNTDLTTIELSKSSFGQVAGRTYSISFEISDYVSGTFQPQFNGQIIAGVTANGVYNYIVSANNTGGSFYLYALSSPKFSVDNVSVKEITLSESYVQTVSANDEVEWASAQPYIPQYAMSSYSKKAIFGGAGSGDYIDCSSDSTIDNIFDDGGTWSVWISGDSDGGNSTGTFLSKGQCRFRVTQDTGDDLTLEFLHLFTNSGSSDNGLWKCPTTALLRNKLNHVAVTYDNSSPSNDPVIYINGVAHTVGGTPALTEGLDPGGTRDTDAGSDLVIGNVNAGSADHYFDGFIDEVAIFDKILTEAEVQEIFNAGIALDCRDHSCYYGDEVLTNGDFSASGLLSDGYQNLGFIEENGLASISNGELSITAASGEVFGSVYATVGNSSRNILEAPGVFYKFTYTITEVSGSQNIEFYSQPGGWTSLTAEQMTVGTHTIILETAGRNFAVRQRTDGSIVKFSSWSVKKIQLNGYWRNNGVDTWVDLSLYGNNGTVHGSPTTIQLQEVPYFKKDTFGLPMNRVREKGLNFDGDSYVRIDSDSSLTSPSVSVECWIKMKEIPETLLGAVSKYEASAHGPWLLSVKTNLDLAWYQNGGSSPLNADDLNEDKMSIDTWRHVVATYDGTVSSNNTRQIYIDGVLRKTGQQANTDRDGPILDPNNEVVEIGRYNENITRADNVMIDDVKVYNRVLSASEIKKNYKATKSKHKNNLTSNWSDDFSDGFI